MNFFISGGGTGGHFFPALALLECLLERGFSTLFVGSERGIEFKLRDRIPTESLFLPSHPFMGRGLWDKLRAIYGALSGAMKLRGRLRSGDVGIVFGGYTTLPLGLACLFGRLPLFVHEQNSVPSQTNRLLGRFARMVFITFEHSRGFFHKERTIKTGLPIRKSLIEGLRISKVEASRILGLDENFTLLIMGGSQGASFLNSLAMEVFYKTGWQGIHITGERDFEKVSSFYREKALRVYTLPFSDRMELIYKASDLAISRAGASSITELSLYGIPTLFIPFPYAIHDHQYYNAKEIEELGGGITLRQGDASLERVLENLEKMISDRDGYSKSISTFANPLACQDIVKYLLKE
ncbi:MAG: undecaprenyldiphospho-muramoylpentapeptide beta-N-acetylglucosaminyltransferase [Acidobacteria bacterium]|jgi:UDP-N-acetylglucosamine--N-acetylmuramyl-(pentapeptide) pyrophosphoryl-undecaprenol N-acetylglucosamine transferase|nr:MAG: undecaprenyldiphospho-muramoylpentapeptide beta-N-acetylglucosaminyltransferase [Acidobacteriota bacterium]